MDDCWQWQHQIHHSTEHFATVNQKPSSFKQKFWEKVLSPHLILHVFHVFTLAEFGYFSYIHTNSHTSKAAPKKYSWWLKSINFTGEGFPALHLCPFVTFKPLVDPRGVANDPPWSWVVQENQLNCVLRLYKKICGTLHSMCCAISSYTSYSGAGLQEWQTSDANASSTHTNPGINLLKLFSWMHIWSWEYVCGQWSNNSHIPSTVEPKTLIIKGLLWQMCVIETERMGKIT